MKRSVFQLLTAATLGAAALAVASLGAAPYALAANSEAEIKCSATMTKGLGKLHKTYLKEVGKCRNNDIDGSVDDPGLCDPLPTETAEKIQKAVTKLEGKVAKTCRSTCSHSGSVSCITDLDCPPRLDNEGDPIGERCTGDGTSFDARDMGFPGPYCTAAIGGEIETAADLGTCVSTLGLGIGEVALDGIYGSVDNMTGISEGAADCLKNLAKAASKASGSMAKAIGACRDAQNALNNPPIDPNLCAIADEDTAAAIDKIATGFTDAVAKKCTASNLAELDLCGAGVGGVTSVAAAQSCLLDLVHEAAHSEEDPTARTFVSINMINAAYPDSGEATCGDGLINQDRDAVRHIAEECDGDDTPCGAGSCFPPGDTWECTCDNIPRIQLLQDGAGTDSDAGWNGKSHNATGSDGSGYIAELSNCNCDEMTGATCTGTSTDLECDVTAALAPRCSDDPGGTESCDERGNGDGSSLDADCYVCDSDTADAGTFCASDADCQSRCFDAETGAAIVPDALCEQTSDCAAGQVCKGRCDSTLTCNVLQEGPPIPLVAAGVGVCVTLDLFTDLVGTKDIETGEESASFENRSHTHLSEFSQVVPCPTCGGSCSGGDNVGEECQGTCDVSGDPCLADTDCTGGGDSECTDSSPDCPDDGEGDPERCILEPVCRGSSGYPDEGKPCRPQSTSVLGTVSADCPPTLDLRVTVDGVHGLFDPMTTETVEFPPSVPCTATNYENFDCPCPDDGGEPSRPNGCAPACNAVGANFGVGCATTGGAGQFTTCVGGDDDGDACDEDSDCDSNDCSGNPTHCTAGGASKIGRACTVNSFCDTAPASGDGVCGNACPGGRCVPLCIEEGVCDSGTRAGAACASDAFCTGGGDCVDGDDPFEGVCAAGPKQNFCSGEGFTTLPCGALFVGTFRGCEYGSDGVQGNTDDIVGAGMCVQQELSCFVNNGIAEGGDTGNGNGDPSNFNVVSAFCTPANANSAANTASGFGGPSRTRRTGTVIANFDSLE